MRILKWISIGLGSLVLLLLVAALVIVWFVDPNAFRPRIESTVRDATGRDFKLAGDIEIGFFPWLALRAGEGSLGNAPGFGPQPMVEWKSAQVGAQLLPLLRGEVIADRVRLNGVTVRLHRKADGKTNWDFGADADPAAKATEKDESKEFRVGGVEITDSTLVFIDEQVGAEQAPRTLRIDALNFTTDDIAPGAPFTDTEISGVLHMEGFAAAGVPFNVDVLEVKLGKDMTTLEAPTFSVRLGEMAASGGVNATLGEKVSANGQVTATAFNLRALLTQLGVEAPLTTDPNALTAVSFTLPFRHENDWVTLDPLALGIDDTHLTGKLVLALNGTDVGQFTLRGDFLDLARYLPPTDPNAEPFVLPLADMRALRFRGTLDLEQARLDDVQLKGVTLRLIHDEKGLRSETR